MTPHSGRMMLWIKKQQWVIRNQASQSYVGALPMHGIWTDWPQGASILRLPSLAQPNFSEPSSQQGCASQSYKCKQETDSKYLETELRTDFVFRPGYHTFRGMWIQIRLIITKWKFSTKVHRDERISDIHLKEVNCQGDRKEFFLYTSSKAVMFEWSCSGWPCR